MILNEKNTFSEWAKYFLIYKKNKVSNGYYKSLYSAVTHANDFLGNYPLVDITSHQIDDMMYSSHLLNYRTKQPLGRKSIKNIRDTVSGVYIFAQEENPALINCLYNPAKGRKVPTEASVKKRDAISVGLQNLLVSNPNHFMYLAAMTFLLCGPRRGELIPLEWTDFDLEMKLLSINKSVIEKGNAFIVRSGLAKTTTSIRKIPIPDILVYLLLKALPYATGKFIFSQPYKNEMHTPSTWAKAWENYMHFLHCCYFKVKSKKEKVKLFHITPHMLRHTYATNLYNAGVDVLSAAKYLGHANPDITMKIYTHLQREKESAMPNRYSVYIDRIFATYCGDID